MSEEERWSKVERLAVAASVAPTLRSQGATTRMRRIARVDADGNVIGYTTLGELQQSLLKRKAIEIAVQPGVRPEAVFCGACGLPVPQASTGRDRKFCDRCKNERRKRLKKTPQCAVCRRYHIDYDPAIAFHPALCSATAVVVISRRVGGAVRWFLQISRKRPFKRERILLEGLCLASDRAKAEAFARPFQEALLRAAPSRSNKRGMKAKGSCVPLRRADGTVYYRGRIRTITGARQWLSLPPSVRDCMSAAKAWVAEAQARALRGELEVVEPS